MIVSPAMEMGAMMNVAASPKPIASKIIPTIKGMAIKITLQMER